MNVWKEALRDDLLTVVLTKIACQRISWYLSRKQPAEDLISMFWRMASIALQRYQRCHWAETSIGSYLYVVFLIESTSLLFDCLMITFSWFIDLLCVVYYAIDCKYNMHAYKMQCNNIQNHKNEINTLYKE